MSQYCSREDGDRSHEFVRSEIEQDEDGPLEWYTVRCSNCAGEHEILKEEWIEASIAGDRRAARRRANLTKYPYFEPHTGELVKSAEHRAEVAKRYGLHEAENGVNEKFDDEFSHQIKRREADKKERRKKMRRELRKLGKFSVS